MLSGLVRVIGELGGDLSLHMVVLQQKLDFCFFFPSLLKKYDVDATARSYILIPRACIMVLDYFLGLPILMFRSLLCYLSNHQDFSSRFFHNLYYHPPYL
ncbi:hypothetical protein L6164_014758 [Bauhinia variegata]|uniref:Uncharacterized protein n=1 Tax=Bauhinia variegata TaxID=167791 RepID=A0ACB9NIL3_BAUVA|nr:hypothetical protein L6164_014758 [Bauhinia variegata]